jgi:hypothetical protein
MKNRIVGLLALGLLLNLAPAGYAQTSAEPKRVGGSVGVSESSNSASDLAWAKALPIIERDAKNGKPFIPWAATPKDLPQADILAFPGAEGGGAYSFGGRGGRVFVVKTLADSGPGSLREACEQGGARIIVFNVAGIIHLESPIIIRAPYITIAGNTAPGDGVCIASESIWVNTHDVVVRHMRFRRGTADRSRRDDAIGGHPVGNIIIDHVSAGWGLDENMSMYRHMYDPEDGSKVLKLPTVNITIQNSIFSETLNTFNHAFGSTIGGFNSMFVRNLWACNTARNPSVGMFGDFNLVNNVMFNWRHRSVDGGDYRSYFNIINNYYKPGPATPKDQPVGHRFLKPESGRSKLSYKVYGRAHVEGNILFGNDKITKDNWAGGVQVEDRADAGEYTDLIRSKKRFAMADVKITPAEEAYKYVMENVGATLPKRDAVDLRIVEMVKTGKVTYQDGIITDISQVGGYPEYKGTPYADADDDGMPDEWEKKHKLNPNDASDAVKDRDNDGYTNIEEFINNVKA